MSVYINGVEMPTGNNNITLFLFPDGKVVVCGMLGPLGHYEAIPVPEHGDLIDLSAKVNAQYYDDMTEEWNIKTVTVEDVLYGICEKMPLIIIPADPADKEGER